MNPVQIAIVVIALVTLLGVIISLLRKSSALAGYDEIKAEVSRITSALKGEMFRDGDDLVIHGNYQGRPTQVRFSYRENTPGLNIQMHAPVSFTYSVVPKGAKASEGRVLIRSGNDVFDTRFASRTDHPTQARMLVGGRTALQQIEKLCCSQRTFLTMTRGNIELSELVIPTPYTGRHVTDHLESMGVLGKAVEGIPGAETVKIEPYQRERTAPVFRLVLAAGAIAALFAVFFIRPERASDRAIAGDAALRAEGVDVVDARKIRDLEGWHALRPQEYDSEVAASLRAFNFETTGKLAIDLDGDNQADRAYALRREDGTSRIIVLRNGEVIYDRLYRRLGGLLPVPSSSFGSVEWTHKPEDVPNGGGVMPVTIEGEVRKGVIMFLQGDHLASAEPREWRAVSLR